MVSHCAVVVKLDEKSLYEARLNDSEDISKEMK